MSVTRRRFGQHFLHDRGAIERIVAAVAPQPTDRLVEIGPGRGAITTALLGCTDSLDAIEIDRDLAEQLRRQLADRPGFHLHEADALKFDLAALAARRGGPLRVVGNLPYNISTPLLFRLLEQRDAVSDLHVMLQKEVVDRMVATPGSKDFGRLTVMLAPYTEISRLFDVSPDAFTPPPAVWSTVVRVQMRSLPAFEVPPGFARLVAAGFSQRRKTLRNALRGLVDAAGIESCGIDPGSRAETLAPADFARLAAHSERDSVAHSALDSESP
ncbi:MAG: 16S rRNA (adenine(1518)-N(6)/adenine(1519)-N(6))-dimethyltransferase RsmA [Pseudomonadales bacterium]|nr:16S rRNA (adenine(1518)-N(6)/adenine(1519)-N(6))-dimethyltransferase RsmA [Pseudomonadales bacterium]